ncbi:MAG TPA: aspartate carbamoyltransferase [Firmicutes bacterium]|nr:aspartate carbamoyltransferase [Bacillota bacterium]
MNSLVSSKDLGRHTIELLLQNAQAYADNGKVGENQGTVVNLFFENSTRTDLSFQMAAQHLGLRTLDFNVAHSSTNKGESLRDTLETLEALGVDVAVIRHQTDWPQELEACELNLSLVNAGSGVFEHPTQALLDALTMRQHFGRLRGLKVTIVGDIRHSRVARSNLHILTELGAHVQFAGPDVFRADDLPEVPWVDLDSALEESDVLMMLRVQHERHAECIDVSTYHEQYGLTELRLARLRKDALIMHPGPVNRGVEICSAGMEDPRNRILQQVRNGVFTRMAVLDWCLQGGKHGKLVSA